MRETFVSTYTHPNVRSSTQRTPAAAPSRWPQRDRGASRLRCPLGRRCTPGDSRAWAIELNWGLFFPAQGIPALLPFLKAVCQSKKSWQARHTGVKIIQQIAILMGCAVLPHLRSLVEIMEQGLVDENQKVRTCTGEGWQLGNHTHHRGFPS